MNLEQLVDQFEVVTTSDIGIKKLRQAIIDLGLRGELTKQFSTDEPADELIKSIRKERELLYKEGKIRKPRDLDEIKEKEIPYELPKNWKWTRLGFISNYRSNDSISPNEISDDTWVLGLGDIEKDTSRIIEKDVFANRKSKSNKYKFEKGDVLYGKLRPNLNKVVIADDDGVCSTEIIPIKGYADILNQYIKYALKRSDFLEYTERVTYGTKMPRLGTKDGQSALFPLAPIQEQQRIVQKIETLFTQVDELEQIVQQDREVDERLQVAVLNDLQRAETPEASRQSWQRLTNHFEQIYRKPEHIDQLKQAILNEAVRGRLVPQDPNEEPAEKLLERVKEEKQRLYEEGEIRKPKDLDPVSKQEIPYEIPENWIWVKFNEMANFINGDRGKNYPNKSEYVNEGIPWINTGHITKEGTLTTKDMNYITREKYNSLRSGKIQEGDLVYCLRGATFGKTAFVEPYAEGAIASSLMIIRTYLLSMNEYVFHYLLSPVGRNQLFRFDNGSAQPNLSASSVKKYAFPLPPVEEQKRIVNKIDELFTWCEDLKEKLSRSQQTDQRLLEALVNGHE